MNKQEFLNTMAEAAITAYKIKPNFNPVVAVAQAALESGWGTSQLFKEANNVKGVKSGRSWKGATLDLPTKEFNDVTKEWYTTVAKWRKYKSYTEAFLDYGQLIERVFPQALAVVASPSSFLRALVSNELKYATDPNYFNKVSTVINAYAVTAIVDEVLKIGERQKYEVLVVTTKGDNPQAYRYPFVVSVDGQPLDIKGRKIDIRFL